MELHVVDDVRSLSFVWRNHTDLTGVYSGLEEFGHDLLNVRGLGPKNSQLPMSGVRRESCKPIQEGRSAAADLFLSEILVKEHRSVWHRPREIHILPQTLRRRNTVLKRPFVEHVRRELRKTGMHTVLNLQTDGAILQGDESFEQRLMKTSAGSLLVHNNGSELLEIRSARCNSSCEDFVTHLMITYKNDLFATKYKRYHALCVIWVRVCFDIELSVSYLAQPPELPHR